MKSSVAMFPPCGDFNMRRAITSILISLVLASPGARGQGSAPDAAGLAFFESKIRPILVEHCYRCHSVNAQAEKKLKAGLFVDSRMGLINGGESGPAVVPGKPKEGTLLKALRYTDPDLRMPPKGKLPSAVIADFEKWIAMGAPDPREEKSKAAAIPDLEKARKEHWAFRPLAPIPLPKVKNQAWVRTPTDAFILQRLEARGIAPAPEAEPATLLRRVYLDLIGLPPSPEEQRAFLENPTPQAYEKVVDDLLQRPQYGERWGRHWLDVARYGETCGYESDNAKPNAWRYRDWVIAAFNKDMPYNQFVTEQLAGDEMPDSNLQSQLGTVFLNLGTFDTIAADSKQARYDHLDDVVGTTFTAFLGLTLQCCRCHDHKFEPLSQKDYYGVLAAFAGMKVNSQVQVGGPRELEAFKQANEKVDEQLAPLFEQLAGLATPLLEKAENAGGIQGKKTKLDAKQVGNLLKTIQNASSQQAASKNKGKADLLTKELNRIEEALREIAAPEVMDKIKIIREQVKTINATRPQPILAPAYSEDKNASGTTNLLIRGEVNRPGPAVSFGLPEVLGAEFPSGLKTGGRRLAMAEWMTGPGQHLTARVIVNRLWQYHFGQGFLQDASNLGISGGAPTYPELLDWLAQDLIKGEWKLKRLHRQIVLSAVYRQSAQNAQAKLDPDNLLFSRWRSHRLEAEVIRDSMLAVSGKLSRDMGGDSQNSVDSPRRSVYLKVKRNGPILEMTLLGLPDSAVSCSKRVVSTTPVQSLLLLNGSFANQQAKLFAERLSKEAGKDVAARVRLAYALALCRPPRDQELQAALRFLQTNPSQDDMQAFCLILLNTNEFVYAN